MNKSRMQKRGDKEKPSQREGTRNFYDVCYHLQLLLITTSLSKPFRKHQSEPTVIQRQGEREKLKLRQLNANYKGQSLSESNKIKGRESRVDMCTNLVPRSSPPPTACICILQVTKNWNRGKPGNEITSIPHAYVY